MGPALFLRSLFVQVFMNMRHMQARGFRFMTRGEWDFNINTNPYIVTVLYGAARNADRGRVGLLASVCAMYGDNLFWNLLKPAVLIAGLAGLLSGYYWISIASFVIYNTITIAFRLTGFHYGRKHADDNRLFSERVFVILPKVSRIAKLTLIGTYISMTAYLLFPYLKSAGIYAILPVLIILILTIRKEGFVLYTAYIVMIIAGIMGL